MSNPSRTIHRGNVSMYDLDGNHFLVAVYITEVMGSEINGTGIQWSETTKSYQCKDGPVHLRDDGTFQVVLSGELIFPKP